MKRLIHQIVCLFIFQSTFTICQVTAQNKVQVVTKEVNRSFEWSSKLQLRIIGERADIFCSTHDLNVIECSISIVSKHSNKEIAKRDLEKMILKTKAFGKEVFLRNYVEITGGNKPEASLKVIYRLKIPKSCSINMNNYFGKITINDLRANLTIDSEFSEISIQKYEGDAQVLSKFGNIVVKDFQGKLNITSNRSNIELDRVSGSFSIAANVARVELSEIGKLEKFKIKSTKSQVYINRINTDLYEFNLKLDQTELKVSDQLKFKNESDNIHKHNINYNSGMDLPLFSIEIETGLLSIN